MSRIRFMSAFVLLALIGCASSKHDRAQRAAPEIRAVAFIVDRQTQLLPPDKPSRALKIRSIGYDSITIEAVSFNGEQPARLADFDGKQFVPADRSFPVALATDATLTLFQSNPAQSDYSKEISFLILNTDHGIYRYELPRERKAPRFTKVGLGSKPSTKYQRTVASKVLSWAFAGSPFVSAANSA